MKIQTIGMLAMLAAPVCSHATPEVAVVQTSRPAPTHATDCSADGNIEFICGVPHAEDLQRIPRSDWVIASGLEQQGLRFVNTRDFRYMPAFPATTSRTRFDRQKFPDCPGPAVEEGMDFHGINLREGQDGIHTLYAVRHVTRDVDSRESIEVFEIDARQKQPIVTWIGCVLSPAGIILNSVTPLPGEGFVSSNFNWPGNDKASDFPKEWSNGQLWEWQPGKIWKIVPGSEFLPGPNGLEASRDGKWLYINIWPAKRIIRLSRGQTPVRIDIVEVPFNPDNIHWNEDDVLLVAGQRVRDIARLQECMEFPGHFGRFCPDVISEVARLDPNTLKLSPVLSYPARSRVSLATVALQVGQEIWISSDFFDRIVRHPLP